MTEEQNNDPVLHLNTSDLSTPGVVEDIQPAEDPEVSEDTAEEEIPEEDDEVQASDVEPDTEADYVGDVEDTDTNVEGPGVPVEEADPDAHAITGAIPDLPPVNEAAVTALLSADAKNRAWRTLLQNLTVDVIVTAVVYLGPVIAGWSAWGDVTAQWKIVAFSLGKTVLLTVFSFIMRRFMDKSALPTPKPPVISGDTTDPDSTGNSDQAEG